MEASTGGMATALDQVGPRLKQLHTQRGVTLVCAPEVADPRIRLRATKVHGRTVLLLTRSPGGLQAWRIMVPASTSTPAPKAPEGYEWLFVLSGRMRLVLGDHDLVLGAGVAAEDDTRVQHSFGSTGEEPAEILSKFGPQGERVHARARTTGKRAPVE